MQEHIQSHLDEFIPITAPFGDLTPRSLDAASEVDGGIRTELPEGFLDLSVQVDTYFDTVVPEKIIDAAENGLYVEAGRMLGVVSEADRAAILDSIPELNDHDKPRQRDWPDPELEFVVNRLQAARMRDDTKGALIAENDLRTAIVETVPDAEQDMLVRKKALWQVEHLPDHATFEIVSSVLRADSPHPRLLNTAVSVIECFEDDKKAALIDMALLDAPLTEAMRNFTLAQIASIRDTDLQHRLRIKHAYLYPVGLPKQRSVLHDIAHDTEVMQFEKTGSSTYVLPSHYEASVRQLDADSLAQWWKLYTAFSEWHDAGFKYVPIEPILNINAHEGFEVLVTAGNLRGDSMDTGLLYFTTEAQNDLMNQRGVIRSMMRTMGIDHGHDHMRNFVAVPGDKASNEATARRPKSYVIDFDLATYSKR